MRFTNIHRTIPHISIHTLKSKKTSSSKTLVITGYDYFLQKRDLKFLLAKYAKIILVPKRLIDTESLVEVLLTVFAQNHQIHLVTNPAYDRQYEIIYQLSIKDSKIIEISTVHDFCEKCLKKTYVPETIEESVFGLQKAQPFNWKILLSKKIMDILACCILLPLTLPVWFLVFLVVKFQSPGHVFYKQKRLGHNNIEFECIKFRSMRLDAEANGAKFASRNDDRVFPFGRLMRITRTDELPQLLNLLRGEISLIGPRPERKVFVETFVEEIPYYNQRSVVKPGISGYAQVMYTYGTGVKDARHKLMYDLYYITNWSLTLELTIVWRTLVTVLLSRGI